MAVIKIYEGVKGLLIDCILFDKTKTPVDHTVITASHFHVLRPGATVEEIWSTAVIAPNILRHTVPADAIIIAGKYKIQPYIETVDGFKGLWGATEMVVSRKWK